jgi:isopenicillin-N epimerase
MSVMSERFSSYRQHWTLDPAVAYLNHGSFGACPVPVLEEQARLRERMEREPVLFLDGQLEGLLDGARRELGAFLGADPEGIAWVPNATHGVNTVLAALPLGAGDELLVTDHEYNACRNALEFAARRAGARVVVARLPFPLSSPDQVLEAVLAALTPRTRLALIDHVTSPTALVLPVERLVPELAARGVDTLVDGAHSPGQVALELHRLAPAYYTGNLHKWLCTPKGSAFLWVREDRRAGMNPLAMSHGFNSTRTDRSRFRLLFDWTGTCDPTPWLCIPTAIRFLGGLLEGGWPALRARNHALALEGRDRICRTLGVPAPAPDGMLGSMASVPLPDSPCGTAVNPGDVDPLHHCLFERHRLEVPVFPWPAPPRRLVRVSAHLYNQPADYDRLAEALAQELGRP